MFRDKYSPYMVTDELIDVGSAQYYCAFKGREFLKAIDAAVSERSEAAGKDALAKVVSQAGGRVNEALFLAPLAVPLATQAAGAIFALAAAYFGSNAATLAAKSVNTDATLDALKSAEAAAAKPEAIQLPKPDGGKPDGMKKKSWWQTALASVGAGVSSFFGWLAAMLTELGIKISAEALAGVFAGIGMAATYLAPRVALWVRRMLKGDAISEVRFETTAGDRISCWLSAKDFKWHCCYLGARLASKTRVPEDDAVGLMRTEFFEKFRAECERTLSAVLEDRKRLVGACAAVLLVDDSREAEAYRTLIAAKRQVMVGVRSRAIIAQ